MAMKIRMINIYDQKATIIYSDDRDLLIRNLLEVFCIEEDNTDERQPKDVAFITTPYKIEISEELHGKLLKAITDIKRRAINKIVISSMLENYEVQNTIIERKQSMEVKAKNVSRGDEINIVSDNMEVIANIILNELCSLDEVTHGAATYKTEYDFDIKDQDKLTKYILLSAAQQTPNPIHTVHIKTYYDGFPYNQISFCYYQ